jgi:hypothetical protein
VVFQMKTKRKTTPAAFALVASRNFLMTPPPLLAVMQGGDYWLHSNLFTRSKGGDYESRALARVQFLIFPPEIQQRLCRFQNLSVVHSPHKDRVIAGKVLCDDLTLHDRD